MSIHTRTWITAIILCAACISAAAGAQRIRYYNTAVGFAFRYPVGWKSAPLPNNDGTVLTHPSHPGARMKVWGFSLAGGTVRGEVAKVENEMRNGASAFAVVKEASFAAGMSRKKALCRIYRYTARGEARPAWAQGIYIEGAGMIYVFLGACPESVSAKLRPVFEAMAGSFTVVRATPGKTDGGEH